jgi:hypothetical protein
MEELVLQIGGCTGGEVDKFAELNIPVCRPGWRDIVEPPTPPDGQANDAMEATAGGAVGEGSDGVPAHQPKRAKKLQQSKKSLEREVVAAAVDRCAEAASCAQLYLALTQGTTRFLFFPALLAAQ